MVTSIKSMCMLGDRPGLAYRWLLSLPWPSCAGKYWLVQLGTLSGIDMNPVSYRQMHAGCRKHLCRFSAVPYIASLTLRLISICDVNISAVKLWGMAAQPAGMSI